MPRLLGFARNLRPLLNTESVQILQGSARTFQLSPQVFKEVNLVLTSWQRQLFKMFWYFMKSRIPRILTSFPGPLGE